MLYCITHGRAHREGEQDNVALLGDDLACIEEDWATIEGQVTGSQWEQGADEFYYGLTTGMLAYLSSTAGLVPVKIVDISQAVENQWVPQAKLKVTGARPGFERGAHVTVHAATGSVFGRDQVVVSRGQVTVLGPHRFIDNEGTVL